MADKFIDDTIQKFFDIGILECSIFQLNSLYEYSKKKLATFKPSDKFSDEQIKWLNFYKMILIYITETKVKLRGVNENFKVDFNGYLKKVYGVSVGEISDEEYDYLFLKYKSFIEENCCSKCLDAGNTKSCQQCPCGEAVLF